jgi:hypothetical protein
MVATGGWRKVGCCRAQDWAIKHASVFALSKYKLLHFINPQTGVQPKLTPLPLDDGTLVSVSQEAERYLGFWLDPKLSFTSHRAKASPRPDPAL